MTTAEVGSGGAGFVGGGGAPGGAFGPAPTVANALCRIAWGHLNRRVLCTVRENGTREDRC